MVDHLAVARRVVADEPAGRGGLDLWNEGLIGLEEAICINGCRAAGRCRFDVLGIGACLAVVWRQGIEQLLCWSWLGVLTIRGQTLLLILLHIIMRCHRRPG